MTREITAEPLSREAFAPFGDVLDTDWPDHFPINNGRCRRYHEIARVDATGPNARAIINIFRADGYAVPHTLDLVERHPFGSQAFMPLSPRPFLVIVCPDEGGVPGAPRAFVTAPHQGINYLRNVWHGVLTPIGESQDFIVIDRGGDGPNLEEYHFPRPYTVHLPPGRSAG